MVKQSRGDEIERERERDRDKKRVILIQLIVPVISRLFFRYDFFLLVLLIFTTISCCCRIFHTQVISAYVAVFIFNGLLGLLSKTEFLQYPLYISLLWTIVLYYNWFNSYVKITQINSYMSKLSAYSFCYTSSPKGN